MATLLTVDEARRLILERVTPLPSEPVPLADAAGRVLAEAARAAVDLPAFPSSAMDGFALRAAGYGFEGVEIDGNDVIAVYDAACDAVERARSGGGPSLIEAVTYRMSFHNTTDNPARYQDPKEFEEARTRDPIERVQKYLAGLGMWDAKRDAAWTDELREENEKALTQAAGAAAPRPEDVFANVYQDPPPRVLRQRAELVDGSGG